MPAGETWTITGHVTRDDDPMYDPVRGVPAAIIKHAWPGDVLPTIARWNALGRRITNVEPGPVFVPRAER